MHRLFVGAFTALMIAGCATASPAPSPPACRLVIAGGALADDNDRVWQAFIDAARDTGPIVIVPAASGYPAGSGQSVADNLIRQGWPADRVVVLPLAVIDDPDTDDVDESLWTANAEAQKTFSAIEGAAAIWFTGGDQARIAQLFGTRTLPRPALEATDAACASGAPIGGTSAGAAIMSDPMLLGGDSLPAMLGEADRDKGGLETGSGLGFFRFGIVDQHFGQRSRQGRMLSALALLPDKPGRIGFGVDENTAMIFDPDGTIRVEGAGHVTVIDARRADLQRRNGLLRAEDVRISLLAAGDSYGLLQGRITPAPWRNPTIGREYFAGAAVSGTGLAVPQPELSVLLGEGLVDNSAAVSLQRFTFDTDGRGFVFRFTQTGETRGHWGRDANGDAAYTIEQVRLDMRPIQITIKEVP